MFNNLLPDDLPARRCSTGTLYPLALEALTGHQDLGRSRPSSTLTFGPIADADPRLAMPLGQSLAWKRGDLLGAVQRLMAAAAVGLAVSIVSFALTRGGPVLAPVGAGSPPT